MKQKWTEKVLRILKKILFFCLNPRLLLCFGIAWFITNGWSYVFIVVGGYFEITWMLAVGLSWAGLLWVPFTPEKIVTLFIAIFLLRILFPKDQKTLRVLKEELAAVKRALKNVSNKHRRKRRAKWLAKELAKRRANK